MEIRFVNEKIVKLKGITNPEQGEIRLNERGKREYARLLGEYPPGPERDRLVHGIWCPDANPEAIK